MTIGTVHQVDIEQQMQTAYLDYAMSVIVSRALPDVRDGLKPVHRRILYAMHDMGLQATKPYRKSARIVGEVLGKYHPHGDAAVYEAMVRMAQNFSMRLPLVDGQGNFGSVDGDRPAAMRYTEARLTNLANEIMADIDQDTVDFIANFDGSLQEPDIVPTRFPNFLVNGATGIAVGMATSVPPHNLDEVCDALLFMLDQQLAEQEVTLDELMTFIKGPDFPTGGIIHRFGSTGRKKDPDSDQLKAAYAIGRGRITVQAKVHIEEMSRNRHRLVVTELPYQTNKANLVEKIANLARDEKIEGIADLRDESDRQGMRLVIELTRMVEPRQVLKQLFKMTPMQGTFSINMLALVKGEPTMVSLKRALQLFIEHRQEIITRRSDYELRQARDRLHILEGLRIALANLEDVVQTIIRSRSADTAKKNLCKKYKLTETQVGAILDIPLRRLVALERKKIETEYQTLVERIAFLEELLQTPTKILQLIKEELIELKANYSSPRWTTIIEKPLKRGQIITASDLIPDEALVVAISRQRQICCWSAEEHLQPAREQLPDALRQAIPAHSRDQLYLLTETGEAVMIPLHRIPRGEAPGDGSPITELLPQPIAPVVAGVALPAEETESPGYLFLISQQGRVKRITVADLQSVRGQPTEVMSLDDDDKLLTAFITPGDREVMLVTQLGQAIRFAEEEVRAMGLSAAGVWGIKLSDHDQVVGGGLVNSEDDLLLVVTKQGLGKCTPLAEYSRQGRYGQGVSTIILAQDGDRVVTAKTVCPEARVLFISRNRRTKMNYAKSLSQLPRFHAGEQLMSLRGRNRIVEVVTWHDTP